MMKTMIAAIVILSICSSAPAQVIISEVHPNGSGGGAAYAADWFELTNIGGSPVNITGWSMDDESATPGVAPLTGVTTIQPGQSVVFLNAADTSNPIFTNSWFGASPPPGFTIGNYTGSGIGLSTGGDQVWIFDGSNNPVTAVSFPGNTTLMTFDNAAGLGGTTPPPPQVTQLSAAGVNGAFNSFELVAGVPEVGSPGTIPEPTSLALTGVATLLALRQRRKLKSMILRR